METTLYEWIALPLLGAAVTLMVLTLIEQWQMHQRNREMQRTLDDLLRKVRRGR